MLGFHFPKFFFGRLKREKVTGVRADFCEFCVAVTRHQRVSTEAAPTVLFIPTRFEEVDRDSRCEVCRSQFRCSSQTEFVEIRSNAHRDDSIDELVARTNPEVIAKGISESREMLGRMGSMESLQRQQWVNFCKGHQDEYARESRRFVPAIALGTIQIAIIAMALSLVVDLWLAMGLVIATYALVFLIIYARWRGVIYRRFKPRLHAMIAISQIEPDQLRDWLLHWKNRFPAAVNVFLQLLKKHSGDFDLPDFKAGKDFIATLSPEQFETE